MKPVLTITRRGTVTLPAKLRQRDNIKAGKEFEVERLARGEYLLRRKNSLHNEGLVSLLVACSANGWFKSLSRAESTRATPLVALLAWLAGQPPADVLALWADDEGVDLIPEALAYRLP